MDEMLFRGRGDLLLLMKLNVTCYIHKNMKAELFILFAKFPVCPEIDIFIINLF